MRERERKVLATLIDKFLAERREGDGGWAPVAESDIDRLYKILYILIKTKWGKDPDGDVPIEFTIIDRTRFEPMHYEPVPYQHMMKDELEQRGRLDILMMNASIAIRDLDTTLRILRHKEKRQQA